MEILDLIFECLLNEMTELNSVKTGLPEPYSIYCSFSRASHDVRIKIKRKEEVVAVFGLRPNIEVIRNNGLPIDIEKLVLKFIRKNHQVIVAYWHRKFQTEDSFVDRIKPVK